MRISYLIFLMLTCLPQNLLAESPIEDPSSEDTLLKIADDIAVRVSKIRGLELKKKVKKGIKTKAGLRKTLVRKIAEELTDDQIVSEANVFKKLRLIPQDMDYKKMLLDVLTEQVAGFYDPDAKELYVMTGVPLSLQKPAMAHELFHAIQDQHFDLTTLQGPFTPMENADFSMARSALIEGDATVLMYDYSMNTPIGSSVAENPMVVGMLQGLGFQEIAEMEKMMGTPEGGSSLSDSALASAPQVFRESLIFPYFAGMNFVVAVKTGRSWKEFDEVYSNPPVSTEQILHPDKYFSGDVPTLLEFNAALPGYQINFDSTWGEFQWSVFFKTHKLEKEVAAIAAAGWDGDRVIGMKKGDDTLVVAATVWDTDEDASDFYSKLNSVLAKEFELNTPLSESGKNGESTCYLTKDSTRFYVERWGDLVLLIAGISSKQVDGVESDPTLYRLRDQIWKSFKRVDFYEVHDAKQKAAMKK